MKKKFVKQLGTLLLAVMLVSSSVVTAHAESTSVASAQSGLTVEQMLKKSDSPVTKGEFSKLINTYLGLTGSGK